MVISFQNEKVRNFLIEHGEVYTFRKKERKKTGYNWMNEGRGKPKLFNIDHTIGLQRSYVLGL